MKKGLSSIIFGIAVSCVMFFVPNIVSAATLQDRLCGNDRYQTNSKIVDYGWTSSEYAVISVMSSVKAQHDKYNNVIVLGGGGVVSDSSVNSIVYGIQYLNNAEMLALINNADKLGYPVIEANRMPVVYFNGRAYQRMEDKFNSQEKLFSYLNEYYTKSASNRIMNMLELKEIDGAYSKIVGQLGDYSPDILNAKIQSKLVSNNKIDLVLSLMNSYDDFPSTYNATLVYEDEKWRVDYWEGLMVK